MVGEPEDDLRARIERAKAEYAAEKAAKLKPRGDNAMSTGAYALRYSVEFIVAVGVGGFIGYWLDVYFGTSPWGLLILLALGMATGILGMMRAYAELTAAATGEKSGTNSPVGEEKDGKTD